MITDEVTRVEISDNEKPHWRYIWPWAYLTAFWGELSEWKGIVHTTTPKVSIVSGMRMRLLRQL